MAPHSSTLAWKIPWAEEPGGLQSMGLQRVGHDWVTSLSLFTFMHWRRKWQPTPELAQTMSIESVLPSNHLILCCPLLLLPAIFPSIRVFSTQWVLCIRWPKYCSFSFNISPSNDYSGLISFKIDWFALLAVQGMLESLFQHHSSKASIFQHSAFFMVQLSHPYITTGKTIV